VVEDASRERQIKWSGVACGLGRHKPGPTGSIVLAGERQHGFRHIDADDFLSPQPVQELGYAVAYATPEIEHTADLNPGAVQSPAHPIDTLACIELAGLTGQQLAPLQLLLVAMRVVVELRHGQSAFRTADSTS